MKIKNITSDKMETVMRDIFVTHKNQLPCDVCNNQSTDTLQITGNPFTTDGAIAILKCLEISTVSVLKDLHLEVGCRIVTMELTEQSTLYNIYILTNMCLDTRETVSNTNMTTFFRHSDIKEILFM